MEGRMELFHEMRRKDRKLSDEKAAEILYNGVFGVLSTAGEDGYAYGVPLNYVYEGDSIYFHCATKGKKLVNLEYNDKVSFCVISKSVILAEKFTSDFQSVIAFGKASEVSDEEKLKAFTALINKYSPDYIEKGIEMIEKVGSSAKVIKIEVEYLTGKANF